MSFSLLSPFQVNKVSDNIILPPLSLLFIKQTKVSDNVILPPLSLFIKLTKFQIISFSLLSLLFIKLTQVSDNIILPPLSRSHSRPQQERKMWSTRSALTSFKLSQSTWKNSKKKANLIRPCKSRQTRATEKNNQKNRHATTRGRLKS